MCLGLNHVKYLTDSEHIIIVPTSILMYQFHNSIIIKIWHDYNNLKQQQIIICAVLIQSDEASNHHLY